MNNVFTDIELIKEYDSKIGELYENSKNFYLDAPIQALVELRSILEIICSQYIKENSLEPINQDLYSNINELEKTKTIAPYIITDFHFLRIETNKAAHKHEFNLTYKEYSDLALECLTRFCDLIESLMISANNKNVSYKFIPEVKSRLYELSYKAMFEEDKDAKFIVGLALYYKYIDQFNSDYGSYFIDHRPLERGLSLVEESALDNHPEAMFEYGCILIGGHNRDKDVNKGLSFLYKSAALGYTKAKSHFANFTFENIESTDEDIKDALELLYESIDEKDPHGQMLLSKLLKEGKYVDKDNDKSLQLLKLSAEGGNSVAMFELGQHLIESVIDFEAGYKYIIKAESFGYKSAKLYIARVLVSNSSKSETVINWYESYLKSVNDFPVYIELAKYIHSQSSLNLEKLKEAIGKLITVCRLENCPAAIKKKVNQLTPVWLEEYYQQSKICASTHKLEDVFINFDRNGAVIDDVFKIAANIKSITENPRLIERLIYIPKENRGFSTANKVVASQTKKVGRNELCPCGLGKKFKNCCG